MTTIRPVALPSNISMNEMTMIQGGFKQGMTQKSIKAVIDSSRKMSGKREMISTNTISRLSPGSKHHKAMVKGTTKSWDRYEGRKRQYNAWEKTRNLIKDPEEKKKFDKAMKRIVEQSKNEQHRVTPQYLAETDEVYYESM